MRRLSARPDFPASENGVILAEGLSARAIHRPTTPAEVAEVIRTAFDFGQSVVPFGGRLSLSTGNVIHPVDLGLDLTGLSGIHSYLPADLTMSVASGTSFAEISEALCEHGQELPIDVPFPDQATIGGLIATGFAGPRRLGFGSLKDLIIGCEFARGDGLVGHAGGMVVKNVSGFEIPRLLHGSWGSLAVLTSVNLKVMPMPRSEATLIVVVDSIASGLERATRFLASQPSLAACTVTRSRGETSIAVRIMGRDTAVEAMTEALTNGGITDSGDARVLDSLPSRQFWKSQGEAWSVTQSDVLVSTGTRPRDVMLLVAAVEDRFGSENAPIELMVSPGIGSVRFRFDPATVRAEQFWERLHPATLPEQTVAYIESAPVSWRRGTNVWRGDESGDAVMDAIKQQFDPRAILNPGRLFI